MKGFIVMKDSIPLLKRNTTYVLPLCLFIVDYFMIVLGISFAYEARKLWMFPPVSDTFSIRSIYIYLIIVLYIIYFLIDIDCIGKYLYYHLPWSCLSFHLDIILLFFPFQYKICL